MWYTTRARRALTDRVWERSSPPVYGSESKGWRGRTERNEPTISFRINALAFRLALYSRFEIAAAVTAARGEKTRSKAGQTLGISRARLASLTGRSRSEVFREDPLAPLRSTRPTTRMSLDNQRSPKYTYDHTVLKTSGLDCVGLKDILNRTGCTPACGATVGQCPHAQEDSHARERSS